MAPKHGLPTKEEGGIKKRAKSSPSRSATPAVGPERVPFSVTYPEDEKVPKMEIKSEDDAEVKDLKAEEDHMKALGFEFQKSPFEPSGANYPGELDQYYRVEPRAEWNAMKKYNNFIIQGDTYKNNQVVFVRSPLTPDRKGTDHPEDFWIARILQVRAKDQQHVYALVAWLYWPQELPAPKIYSPDQESKSGGKRKYHGSQELVASNYMEVLDVLSFAGKADVLHYKEEDDNHPTHLFWRQTFCRQTQALSKIRKHCICGGHFNPGKTMFICDNDECNLWLHQQCLIENIMVKTYDRLVDGSEDVAKSSKLRKAKKAFQVELKEIANGDNGALVPQAKITDLRAGVSAKDKEWFEDIACLKCETVLR